MEDCVQDVCGKSRTVTPVLFRILMILCIYSEAILRGDTWMLKVLSQNHRSRDIKDRPQS